MLHEVKCINCGANIKNEGNERFITCSYCGSSFGNFTPFEEFDFIVSKAESKDVEDIL